MTQMKTYKLGECCSIIAGQSPESKYYNTSGDGMPFFQGKADFGSLYPSIRVYCTQPKKIAEKDDILLSVRAPVGPTNLAPCKVCIGRGLAAIRPKSFLLTKYLLLYFKSFELQIAAHGTGTTFNSINQSVIKNLEINVPSVTEQQRIISHLEESLSQLDSAVATLNKTKQQLEIYRQAVIKEAFDRVSLDDYNSLKTVIVGTLQNGLYKPKSDYGTGTCILRIDGFYDGRILDDYDYKRVRLYDNELEKYSLQVNDLVINRVNSMQYLGKCALVRTLAENTIFESNMMRIKLNPSLVDYEYIIYYLSSMQGKKELTKNAKQAVNQASINQTDVCNTIVPLPDVSVQRELRNSIDIALSIYKDIGSAIHQSLQQAEALRQSILKQAFPT